MLDLYRTIITQVVRDALDTDIRFINENEKIKPNAYPAFSIIDIFEESEEKISATSQDYVVDIDMTAKITFKEDHNNVGQLKYLIRAEQVERLKRRLLTIHTFVGTMEMVFQPDLISVKPQEDEELDFSSYLINIIYHLRYNMSKGLDAIEIYSKAQHITTRVGEI